MEAKTFDVAVIGLGAVGSATLYQLSKSGARIIGFDRFSPPHTMGSSHGESRITRLAVGEGEEYVALAKRSHEIWNEIERLTGTRIRTQTGGLLIDSGVQPWSKHGAEGFWDRTVRYARNQHIHHRILPVKEMQAQFSIFEIPPTAKVYFEDEAGYLRPELAIETQLELAEKNGARILVNTPCEQIKEIPGGFKLTFGNQHILSKKVVLTAGGWNKDFLPKNERQRLKICRQVLHWLEITPEFTDWENHPVWMWGFGPDPEDFIYGFPSLDGKTLKMATESFLEIDHPDLIKREVDQAEQEKFWETKVLGRIKGLKKNFLESKVCFYTVTDDARFIIEPLNGSTDFLWVSACSGHGFKHSAALGEVLAKKIGFH
jgi:sarcosine oxidase